MIIGKDVPWNAAWTGEEEFYIARENSLKGHYALCQKSAPGEGKPIFASPHMNRQRESIVGLICTVCGKPTPAHDRVCFSEFGERLKIDGRDFWATTEAPVHKECAAISMQRCPRIRQLNIKPVRFPTSYAVVSALVKPESLSSKYKLSSPDGQPVIGHMKIAFPI